MTPSEFWGLVCLNFVARAKDSGKEKGRKKKEKQIFFSFWEMKKKKRFILFAEGLGWLRTMGQLMMMWKIQIQRSKLKAKEKQILGSKNLEGRYEPATLGLNQI